jgi:hypothetical protein
LQIDWLDLNSRGDLVLFRDKRRKLHVFDIATQIRTTLLTYCSFVTWVPGSDVAVAQSRASLCIWYNIYAPDKVTTRAIKGDVEVRGARCCSGIGGDLVACQGGRLSANCVRVGWTCVAPLPPPPNPPPLTVVLPCMFLLAVAGGDSVRRLDRGGGGRGYLGRSLPAGRCMCRSLDCLNPHMRARLWRTSMHCLPTSAIV